MNISEIHIWIFIQEILKILVILTHSKMGLGNLKTVLCVSSQAEHMTYSREFLVQIGKHVEDRKVTVRLSGKTCASIRSLGIRKKTPRRRKRAGKKRSTEERRRINHSHLVNIKAVNDFHIVKNFSKEFITLILVNIRSVKHKQTELAISLGKI